jgi:hypothetical protein
VTLSRFRGAEHSKKYLFRFPRSYAPGSLETIHSSSFGGVMYIRGSPVSWQKHWFGSITKMEVVVRRCRTVSTPILVKESAVNLTEIVNLPFQ